LVVGGGTALASYVISSNSQVGPGTISGHHAPSGKHPNLISGSVGSRDVADNNLTGADIANRSGVDTCPPRVARYGPICAFSDGGVRHWQAAVDFCASKGLRLPSASEAFALAENYDIAGISDSQDFWTDSEVDISGTPFAHTVFDSGADDGFGNEIAGFSYTVCVIEPSA
jgi:hypothetical protein